MKSLCCILLIMGISWSLAGQDFVPSDTLTVSNTIEMQLLWTDWQGDQSPDLLALSKSPSDSLSLYLFEQEDRVWRSSLLPLTLSQPVFDLADMNNDGLLDIIGVTVLEGRSQLVVALQAGSGFRFIPLIHIDQLSAVRVDDFDRNGFRDIAVSATKEENPFNAFLMLDPSGLRARVDLLADTVCTSIISGYFESGEYKSAVFSGESGLVLARYDSGQVKSRPISEKNSRALALADLKSDSLYEFLYSTDNSIRWFSGGLDMEIIDAPASLLFAADFTSDGISDFWQQRADGSIALWQGSGAGTFSESLILPVISDHIAFGDRENDGDLDLALSSSSDPGLIHLFTNEADTNKGPSIVPRHTAIQVGNKVLFFWDNAVDDHTSPAQITYDLVIGTELYDASIMSGGFDLSKARRMVWSPGNNGNGNSFTINGLAPGIYYYGIQSLDNSFYPVMPESSGGSGCEKVLPCAWGSFEVKDELPEMVSIPYCGQDSVQLGDLLPSAWYSESAGFLGFGNRIKAPAEAGDRIYQRPLVLDECDPYPADEIVYVLTGEEIQGSLTSLTVCENELISLRIYPEGDSTNWSGMQFEYVSEGPVFEMHATTSDTIIARTYFNSCLKADTFVVRISKPELKVNPASVVIFKGNSVQLTASGAESYTWTPEDYLDNALIPDPVATPPVSVQYQVIGKDSLHCIDTAFVSIEVHDQAFIPNLFTPNQDNHNDRLFIYGLSNVSEFEFVIYNRNGAVIYRTTNPSEITVNGWDGSRNGNPQPDGVYYWKITGRYDNEDPVLLNGKNEGVIHLMR